MGHVGRLRFNGILPSGEVFNYSLYVAKDDASPTTAVELATAADAFQNALKAGGTPFTSLYTPTTLWGTTVCDVLSDSTGKVEDRRFGAVTMAGTAGGTVFALPPGVAICVSIRATGAGPAARGRMYLPPPITTTVNGVGRLQPASLTTLTGTLANAFTALVGTPASYTVVVYHRATRTFDPAIKGNVGDVFDSMRTRRDKLVETRSPVFG